MAIPLSRFAPGVADNVVNSLFPKPNPWAKNPVGWIRNTTGEHPWSKQRVICRSIVRNRYTAVRSCHDSGKSFIASRLCAWWIDVHPPGDAFVVTTAPTSHQVEAILWREIGRAHRRGSLDGRITLDCKWRLGPAHGDELVAYGRKPADYDPDAFQGIHQRYVLVVIDEANGVPKELFDAVDTIVTNRNGRVLAIGNPDSPDSHFATVCKRDSGWNVIHIDGLETPNFTGEPIPFDLADNLLSPEWVEERRTRWGVGSPMWESKVRGRFPRVADDVLIQLKWYEDAEDREIENYKDYNVQRGYDIARFGTDDSVCYTYQGGVLRRQWGEHNQSTTDIADKIVEDMVVNPNDDIVVDETGIGGGVVDILTSKNFIVTGFISGGTPADDRFVNVRSEAYWHLRELFEFGLISVDPDDEALKTQLTTLKWRVDSKGRIMVEPKEDYKRRMRTKSPDAADAAVMATWETSFYDETLLDHSGGESISNDIMTMAW